jgi:hypothetical protein
MLQNPLLSQGTVEVTAIILQHPLLAVFAMENAVT